MLETVVINNSNCGENNSRGVSLAGINILKIGTKRGLRICIN
jgi:hypothetical protein